MYTLTRLTIGVALVEFALLLTMIYALHSAVTVCLN